MKKIVILFALALLCGCSGANSEFIRCSDQDLTCAELITETVLFSDLEHAAKTENTIDFERSSQGGSEVQGSGTLEVSDFEIIKVGTQVAEVKKLDPSGDYTFMYASWSDYPQCSYHYTRDGYEIVIFYDSGFLVTDILYNKI